MSLLLKNAPSLGCMNFSHFFAERNVKTSLSTHQFERLEKVAIAALKQCDSTYLPQIHKPLAFGELLKNLSQNYYPILAWEEEELHGLHEVLEHADKDICLIIGPEGGFVKQEVDFAREHSAQIVSLGNHILRTETAAITISANTIFYQLKRNRNFY